MFSRFNHMGLSSPGTFIFLNVMGYFIASAIAFFAVLLAVGTTKELWHGVLYAYQHWWFIFQLPAYWAALVFWLLLIIVATFFLSLACILYRQEWTDTKYIFGYGEPA